MTRGVHLALRSLVYQRGTSSRRRRARIITGPALDTTATVSVWRLSRSGPRQRYLGT